MKQSDMIKEFKKIARQAGKILKDEYGRSGIRLVIDGGPSVHLGPDSRQDIHPRFFGRYQKTLGL